jgi:Fur family ferric uptake transcriptional regulator
VSVRDDGSRNDGSTQPAAVAETAPQERRLSRARQRNTRQANAIESALQSADGFRTAQDLFTTLRAAGERVGLSTVYRYLTLMAELGRVDVVHGAEGEARFRLCGPIDPADEPSEHHHHLVCRACGSSVEVSGPQVETWAEQVATAAGYTEVTHTVELFGLCPEHSTGRPQRA